MEQRPEPGLLNGLEGDDRAEREELINWLLDRGFPVEQIRSSFPLMLPANRVMGDDGTYISARELAHATGIDLDLLQRLQRAAGLPRIDDPDAAVLPRADAEAAMRAKFLLDFGLDPEEVVEIVRALTQGLGRAAAIVREAGFKVMVRPGASEVELAQSAESRAQQTAPHFGPLMEGLMLLQFRHLFEAEGINAAERATGKLPGARRVAVAFADISGFTVLGEALPAEDLERLASRLTEMAHDIAVAPVSFIKTIGDAVMFVSPDAAPLIDAVLQLVDAATANGLPQLRAGVASGDAVGRGGDWYGSPVNVASRITAIANPGTVLVAESAREGITPATGFKWSSVGARRLKGVQEQVQLFRVRRDSTLDD